ncbi:aBC-type multidrug/protein/lipid transport system ATPase component [Clostridium sp. CAG:1219]|nr:aBC-type multidrug/protein/lipid transport system ATPase component [Clostridium sp. CAG:1219]
MKKILKFLKPYTIFIIIGFIFTFVQSILNLYLPNLMSDILNNGVIKQDIDSIWSYGLEMIIITLLVALFAVGATFIASRVSTAFGRNLRKKVYEKVESYSNYEFKKMSPSTLITRTTNDVTQVQTFVLMGLRMMIIAPIMCIGGLIMAISTNAKLSIILAVIIPIMVLVILILAKKVLPLFTKFQAFTDRLNQVVTEKLTGVRVIRAFGKEEYERKRYDSVNKDIYDVTLKAAYTIVLLMPLIFFIINISSIAIVWIGAPMIDNGSLNIGDLMAFIQYAMQVLFSVIYVAMMFINIPRAIVSAKRISEVLDIDPSIKDDGTITKKEELDSLGSIEFKNVCFSFPDGDENVLDNISFKINKSETLAIIGGTGSGKTALISLMLRLYDITGGDIYVGGKNIKDISVNFLRDLIGYVPQKAMLFSGTIRENLCYGNKNATKQQIDEALKVAQAYDFVYSQKDGIDSEVSQGGTNFSGGQKQRLCIARAIVKNPDYFIFDDSFSALDYKTDMTLREALAKNTKDATKIIVAQRVSTVLNADKIIYLEDGKILGIGTHKELFESCSEYREVVLSQITMEEATSNGK